MHSSLSLAHPLFLFVYLSHKNINTHNNHTHTLTRTRTNTLTFNLHSFQRYFHTRHTTPTLTLIHTIMHTSDSNTVLPYFVFCLLQMCVCHFSTVNLCAVYTVHGVICARHTPSMLHIETFLRPSAPLPRWSMPFHLPGKKVVLQPPFAQTAAKAPACKNMHSTYASYRDARRRRSRPSPSTSFICFHVFLLLDHCQMYTSTKNSGDDAADSSCHLLNLRKVCTLDQLRSSHSRSHPSLPRTGRTLRWLASFHLTDARIGARAQQKVICC